MILFLGDAGGIPTLNAASAYVYKQPRALFVQHMPHIALSDTSPADSWVTDSAAGMSAIVTGVKTNNGVLSQAPPAPGQEEGQVLDTILEHAEKHGLSTGVISNMSMADATPAACYSHVPRRNQTARIVQQIWNPRYGDGVDLVIGNGRKGILKALAAANIDAPSKLRTSGRLFLDSVDAIPPDASRVVALFDDDNFDVAAATAKAIEILSRNPKGFFLMVEWDLHPTIPARCLETVGRLDQLVKRTAEQMDKDSLVLFTADHSFDFRMVGGKKNAAPVLPSKRQGEAADVLIGEEHSGEEVLVAAQGPGSERVHGVLANTDLFQIMMSALGWSQAGSQ